MPILNVKLLFVRIHLVVLLLTFPVFWSSTSLSQSFYQRWEPPLISDVEHVGDVAISADGRLVAYEMLTASDELGEQGYLSHVWVAAVDGGLHHQFTHGANSCSRPSFSPDGKYLAFLSQRHNDGQDQIWVLPLAGGESWQFTFESESIAEYCWSPNSRSIAYAVKSETRTDLFMAEVPGVGATAKSNVLLASSQAAIFDFAWKPTGQSLIYVRRTELKNNARHRSELVEVALDGEEKKWFELEGVVYGPGYSPNGKWIAFATVIPTSRKEFDYSLQVISSSGGLARTVAADSLVLPQILGWEDNDAFIVSAQVWHARVLMKVARNGGSQPFSSPRINVSRSAMALGRKALALVLESSESLPNVYVSASRKFKFDKLTNLSPRLRQVRFGRTEEISWQGNDGKRYKGLLTYPFLYDFDRRYPVIVMIHPAREGGFPADFSEATPGFPVHSFSYNGYAVLRLSNFAPSGSRDLLGLENHSVTEPYLSGVNYLLHLGVAHPDSLCVMGWDHGGYVASRLSQETNMFKVAAFGVGQRNFVHPQQRPFTPVPDSFTRQIPWAELMHDGSNGHGLPDVPTLFLLAGKDKNVLDSFEILLNRHRAETSILKFDDLTLLPHLRAQIAATLISWFNERLDRGKVVAAN